MTRHNIESHLSWLLNNAPTPPAGVSPAVTVRDSTSESVSLQPLPTISSARRTEPLPRGLSPPTSESSFVRPPIPSSAAIEPRPSERCPPTIECGGSMARLNTAPLSSGKPRITYPVNNQLSTPSSTTASTFNSGLTSQYTAQCRTGGWYNLITI